MELAFRTPMGLLRVYVAKWRRIEARESLQQFERVGVATGSLKSDDAKGILRTWRQAAELDRQKQKRTLPPERLGSIGLGYRKVPPKR